MGDLIAVDGREGHVIEIGPRSTRIRTFDNTEVILPNSQLLERAVVNSTLGDPRVRFGLQIGFAYGSDLRLAQKVLLEAMESVSGILSAPPPKALLASFADSAVVFQLYYYLNLEENKARVDVDSELRFSIAALAAKHGLEIPFSQRTLSTAAHAPLEVKVINS